MQDSLYTAGRRGTGATVFVEKIAGALAEQGKELKSVADVAREVNERSRSFGVALTACTTPASGQPGFDLPDDEIELGVGIHGEPGRERGPMRTAAEIVDFSLAAIDDDMPLEGDLAVMVNGMGGTPLIELYVVFEEVRRVHRRQGRHHRALPRGQLHHQPRHDRRLDHGAPSHPGSHLALGRSCRDARTAMGALRTVMEEVLLVDVTTLADWITRASADIEANKDHLTHLDSAIGDADHGINLVRGFSAVVTVVAEKQPETPGELLTLVGNTLISKVGGASGPLYGTAFRRAGKALGTEPDVAPEALGQALQAALEGVQGLGAAAEGDKTMVDALAPAVRAYQHALATGGTVASAAQAAAAAAEKGAEATIPLQALKGRASYLGAAQRRAPGPGRHVDRTAPRRPRGGAGRAGVVTTASAAVACSPGEVVAPGWRPRSRSGDAEPAVTATEARGPGGLRGGRRAPRRPGRLAAAGRRHVVRRHPGHRGADRPGPRVRRGGRRAAVRAGRRPRR